MLKRNPLRTGLDWLDKLIFVIQAVCLYASVTTVVVTVLMREVFKISIIWGYEIACWFVIILLFLGMPHNLHYKTNIGVTFVYDISPKLLKKIFGVIHFVVEVAVLIMMTSGFKIWITKVGMGRMVASNFTNIAYYGVIIIGVVLSLLEMFTEVTELFVKNPDTAVEKPETPEEQLIDELLLKKTENQEDEE